MMRSFFLTIAFCCSALLVPWREVKAESVHIFGAGFEVGAIEERGGGLVEVTLGTSKEIVPAASLNAWIVAKTFESTAGKAPEPLPGLTNSALHSFILEAAQNGASKESLLGIQKFVQQVDVSPSDIQRLFVELTGIGDRSVIKSVLESFKHPLSVSALVVVPCIIELFKSQGDYVRSRLFSLVVEILPELRRRIVSNEVSALLAAHGEGTLDISGNLASYTAIMGAHDPGLGEIVTIQSMIGFIRDAAVNRQFERFSLLPVLQMRAVPVLLADVQHHVNEFVLDVADSLEKRSEFIGELSLLMASDFSLRTPAVHDRVITSLRSLSLTVDSPLLDPVIGSKLTQYAAVDPRIRSEMVKVYESLVHVLVSAGESAKARQLIYEVAGLQGGWSAKLVGNCLQLIEKFADEGADKTARELLATISNELSPENYPHYLLLRLKLGSSAVLVLIMSLYSALVLTTYLYARRLQEVRFAAIERAYKEMKQNENRPKFVQYWHGSSPILAEYIRNLELLGLKPGVSPGQIKQAYRSAVKRVRGSLDQGRDLEGTEELMKIQAAFKRIQEIESDPEFGSILKGPRSQDATAPAP